MFEEVSGPLQGRNPRLGGYKGGRDLAVIDYIINERPNRAAILGSDSSWSLELSEQAKARIAEDGRNARAAQRLTAALESMGYENMDTSKALYNATAQVYLPDQ